MERLENKIERLSNKNKLLKQEVEEDIKLIEPKHQQLKENISELEDRSRRNNLQFSGFTEKAEGAETWEESENLIREFLEENLQMESKDVIIERAHRTDSKIEGKKRAIIIKFLNCNYGFIMTRMLS